MSSDVRSIETLTVQGARIPRIGFGTWEVTGSGAREAVADAIELGYRHIDTARVYGNETEVGRGIADAAVPRDELFVTTKLWLDDLGADGVRSQAEASLEELDLDRVDLLLIHWPKPDTAIAETLAAMAALREEGLVSNLGLSNFPTSELDEALEETEAPIVCDQVEYHAFLDQSELLRALRERDMALTAYSPLGDGEVASSEVLAEIGAEHGKSAVQVGLRWLLDQDGVVVIPRSTSHENRAANLDVLDFELTPEQRQRVDALPKDRRSISPRFAPNWD